MTDLIYRGLAREGRVRFFVAKTTQLVERARTIHDTYPASSAALGRTLSITAIMATNLKNTSDKLVVEIRGDGDIGYVLADARSNGNVRGLVANPHAHKVNESNGKLDVGGVVGQGSLRVTYKHDDITTFSSQVELQSGEIGDDFAYYYAQSEQIPSALSVGVLVNSDNTIKSAGGILIQILPEATDEDIQVIENILTKLPPVSSLMVEYEAEEIANNLFEDGVVMGSNSLQYVCDCSRDQMLSVLTTLKTEEIQELIEMDNGAELKCQYCEESYHFDANDLNGIIESR